MTPDLESLDALETAVLISVRGQVAGVPTPGILTSSGGDKSISSPLMTKFSWSNADVAGFGAVQSGNLPIATLPARSYVTRAFVVLGTQASGVTTLTASVGVQGPDYLDLIMSSSSFDALQAPGTLLGAFTDAVLPSLSDPTVVYMQFKTTTGAETLDAVLGSSGEIFLEVMVLP